MVARSDWFKRSPHAQFFPAGTVLFRQGQLGDVMYVVQEGEVDILIGETVIETVGEGGLFGELALIDNRPRNATAVARTDCHLIPVDETRFTMLVRETPFFALQVMEAMAGRLRDIDARLSSGEYAAIKPEKP
jgi:CRP-like cAMP-binding protein